MTWAMDELQARATTQFGLLSDFAEGLSAIRERATSPDDLITVEVDSRGAMTGLWFADAVDRLGGHRLGTEIVATAHVAAHRAMTRQAALIEEFAGSFGEMVGIHSGNGARLDILDGNTRG
ncbi:MAG: YbaB/EbfC family DNA-binding protein [Gordonia sp. (in: high G+C Gram-positive bacteria)]